MLIDSNRLIVMNKHDLTWFIHTRGVADIFDGNIEVLGCKTGLSRWAYGI